MFKTKKDVERHVADVISKINSENEKNLRGYTFARLYSQVKDYETAKKYLNGFLSVRDHHAPAHKLMAHIYEVTNNPESALQSYKRSLEIDSRQPEIVLKICELYCQLTVDHETARYWVDRAEQLFPHNETVFRLRECMVSAEGETDNQELENLIANELAAQPKNIGLRIKLLRLYLDTERVKEAYKHATMIESKRLFPYSVEWYYLLADTFEAYQEEFAQELDSEFYISYLTALDRLIFLTLAEPHSLSCENGKKQYSINDAAAVLLIFDQLLKKAAEEKIKDSSWTYFIHHVSGQLYFWMVTLLLKRAKLDQGNRKEALRFSAGLSLTCYTFKPVNLLQEMWFSQLEDHQKAFTNFFHQASLRTSFIGHIINEICKEDKSKWLQRLKLEVCIPQVKERIYSRIFTSVVQKDKLISSYFLSDSTFENCSSEYPSNVALREYDKAASKFCPDSLHHLVWLEMHQDRQNSLVSDNLPEMFKGLQYSNKNLTKGSCESLCILDLEAYLYATVYQAQCSIEKRKGLLSPKSQSLQLFYPPDIADAMCSTQQSAWWKAAFGLHACTIKEKLGEYRRELQHGLEVIRGVGNHGMEVQLIVHLARKFADKADALIQALESSDVNIKRKKPDNIKSLQFRAMHYWNMALSMLEKMAFGTALRMPKEQMFSGVDKPLSSVDIKTLQDDAKLYNATYLMDSNRLEEAAELLSKLCTPYGSYYLALTLQELATQEDSASTTRVALLTRAKNALHLTMDHIKDDKLHPLNKDIYIVLEDIENKLSANVSLNNSRYNEETDETDSFIASPSQYNSIYITPNSHQSIKHSTPRPALHLTKTKAKIAFSEQNNSKHVEPSPERLDAQIRALSLNQDTVVKTLIDGQKTFQEGQETFRQGLETFREGQKAFCVMQTVMETCVSTLKQNTDVLVQIKKLLEDLKVSNARNQPSAANRKASYARSQVEGDYGDYDPSALLDFYGEEGNDDYRNAGYSYNPSSRMVHDAASLNYVLPPGPPSALNHYNYQYPPHAVMPTQSVAERQQYYPTPGQGLPFSEGQQLPQFHFHIASSGVKPPPPIAPPPPLSSMPPLPPVVVPLQPPMPSFSSPMPDPWSKTVHGTHAFQIPLPASSVSFATPVLQVPTATATQSQLTNLLRTMPASTSQPTIGQVTPTTPTYTSSILAGAAKTPDRSRCDSESATSPGVDGDPEREVMGDFKPLIPLPAEVVVETGEENELSLFEDRAKLYRFVDQEWKERGLGMVKILHHPGSGRVRILMRRDQVLKVCANHYLAPHMEIQPLKTSDRAWTWIAQDFADEELRAEKFCIRFKTPELAAAFKVAFQKGIAISKEAELKKFSSPRVSVTDSSPISHKPFGSKFLPKAGSWNCPTCYVSNAADKLFCAACETPKPLAASTTPSGSSKVQSPILSFKATSSESQFAFGTPATSQSSAVTVATANTTPKSIFGGFTFSSSPTIQESETPSEKDREILVISTKNKTEPQVTKLNQSNSSPFSGFSFGKSPTTSDVTVQITGDSRTVSLANSSPFATLGFPSLASTTITPVPGTQQNSANSSMTTNSNLFKMESMIQNLTSSPGIELNASSKSSVSSSVDSKQEPLKTSLTRISTGGSPEEFIPTAEFKPVVPLPDLVDMKTGEEGEEKMFEERAKLFRYDTSTKEWKERGTGELKILYTKSSRKYRILMRRDQVLKICANHSLLPEMKLVPLSSNKNKAFNWFAQDYSEGEVVHEQFAARFKNVEIAQRFYDAFEKCRTHLESTVAAPEKCAGNASAFDKLLGPSTNSWDCENCHKSNTNNTSCIYCKTPKKDPAALDKEKPLSELFKTETASWECNTCYVRNQPNLNKCASCETPKPGSTKETAAKNHEQSQFSTTTSTNNNQPLAELFKSQPGSWECNVCYVRNNADKTKCASCETPKAGTASTDSSAGLSKFQFGSSNSAMPAFSFGAPKTESNFVFGGKPAAQPTTFSFGHTSVFNKENEVAGFKLPENLASNASSIFGGVPIQNASKASSIFGGAPTQNPASNASSIFGGAKTEKTFSEIANQPVTSLFGGSSTSEFKFGSESPPKSDSDPFGFRFGSPQKYEFSFTGVRARSPPKTPKSPRSPAAPVVTNSDDEESDDYDVDNIYFQPAIPLPPKVEVVTGEEHEKVLFCKRAKLFRFNSGEWKERGIGDIKILLDEKTNRLRLLMRREQVLKVCLNHSLTKDIVFEWKGDKSLSWAANDFSDNEASPEQFAVRFKTTEFAEELKQAIDNALSGNTPVATPDKNVIKPAAFSFKTDLPVKTESKFTSGSLLQQFGTSTPEKSLFGNSSAANFSLADANETKSASPFTFSFSSNSNSSSFFGQPAKLGESSTSTSLGDNDVEVVFEALAEADKVKYAEHLKLPKNFYLYENKAPCPGCIGCSDIIPDYRSVSPHEEVTAAPVPIVSAPETTASPAAAETNTPFSSSKFSSFADLASSSSSPIVKTSPSTKKGFPGAGAKLFANLNASANESDEVLENPDIHFEPVIPLPDLVEVKTGEEDEDPLFVHRAKLFRYDPNAKQWKERGIGDIKILAHKKKVMFRVILRRDQVHNVACNHCITKEMQLSPLSTSNNALCWTAVDYSDGKQELTQFAVRFKHAEPLQKFEETFTHCQALLQEEAQGSKKELELSEENAPINEAAAASANHSAAEEDTASDQESNEEDDFLFDKRATLEVFDEGEQKFKNLGLGNLKIFYDDEYYGYHVTLITDMDEMLCDHVIAVQTCLRVEGKKSAVWSALDGAVDPMKRRQFRATFSSHEGLVEFSKRFEEGKEIAVSTGIVEQTD